MSLLTRAGDQLRNRETGQPVNLFIVEQFGFSNYPDGQMTQFIDAVRKNGGNGIRVFSFFPFGRGHEEEPYVRTAGGFDLNQFNDRYYSYLRQWMDHAQKQGIIVLYELFDSVGSKIPMIADYHPFGRYNNGDLQAFSDLGNQDLVAQQKNFLTYTVNILKQYPNVIFGIMNEFAGDANWHYEMSRHVKNLAPAHLTSGSEEGSPAMGDPNVDIWAIHSGSYDFNACQSHVSQDKATWQPQVGGKIVSYSTDGFGFAGLPCENPNAMRNLAQDVKNNGIQIFRFLDQQAYAGRDDAGNEYPMGEWYNQAQVYETAQVGKLNTSTYKAIGEAFPVAPFGGTTPVEPVEPVEPVQPQEGVFGLYNVSALPSQHPDVIVDRGGKAIIATRTQGFLSYGPYVTGLPLQNLDVYYSIYIDNNDADNKRILTLDISDSSTGSVLKRLVITRRMFKKAGEFNLFKIPFRLSQEAKLEFRIFYEGWAYVAADKIAVVDPKQVSLETHADILALSTPGQQPTEPVTPVTPPEEEPPTENDILRFSQFTPELVQQKHGTFVGGTFQNGTFTPSEQGGIEITNLPLDTSRKIAFEFEIEGKLPKGELTEHQGGKLTLFTILGGTYMAQLQRMGSDYRGGGRFRLILTGVYGQTEAAWLITIPDLSGEYTDHNWGNEAHSIRVLLEGPRCQLIIDNFHSRVETAPHGIGGQKQVALMIGNRERNYLVENGGAITKFKNFIVRYV